MKYHVIFYLHTGRIRFYEFTNRDKARDFYTDLLSRFPAATVEMIGDDEQGRDKG